MSVGTHDLFAVYGGDGTFAASQSPMVSQAVNSVVITITTQPANQTVDAGSKAIFTAAASGNPTPTVQWQQSSDSGSTWADISCATSTTLTLADVSVSQNGDEYRAVFTNSAGSATSNAATLNVTLIATTTGLIDHGPNPATSAQAISVTVTVSGGVPDGEVVTIEDASNGNAVVPTTGNTLASGSATLTIAAGALGGGTHELFAMYSGDSTFAASHSPAVSQVVNSAVTITTQPTNQTVDAWSTATFTATASGTPTPTVQWQQSSAGGNTWSNISGATSTTLSLANVSSTQNGDEYRAVFTNSAGNATSNAATLTVTLVATTTGLIDDGPNPATSAQSISVTVTVSGGVPDGEAVTIEDASNGNAVVPTTGDTLAAGSATLTIAAGALGGGTHELFAMYGGDSTFAASHSPAVSQVVNSAVTITTQPANQNVDAGSTATFTATASGIPTPTVQWEQSSDGGNTWSNISGATSTTLTFADVSVSQNGDEYRAVFTNSAGNATSNAAILNVTLIATTTGLIGHGPNPSTSAQAINFTVTVGGGVPDGEAVTIEDASNGNAVVPATGNMLADGSATLTIAAGALSDGTHDLFAVYAGDGTFAPSHSPTTSQVVNSAVITITLQPTNQTVDAGSTATFTAAASGTPTPTVQWQQSGDGGSTWANISGAVSATLTLAKVGSSQDGGAYRAVFTSSAGSATSNAATLTVTLVTTTTGLVDNGPNPATSAQSISLTVTIGGDVPDGEVVTIEDASNGNAVVSTTGNTLAAGSASLTIAAGALSVGTHDLFAVYGGDGTFAASHSSMVSQAVSPAAITITAQPVNQTVDAGSTATFTAAASGDPTPTVQWQQSSDGGSTWANISGATSTMLTLANVGVSQDGDAYRAVFTSGAGGATSSSRDAHGRRGPIGHVPLAIGGAVAGGTTVTIFGSNLGNASAVKFVANGATIVSDSATQIVVNAPAGPAGSVNVTVVTTAGTSAASSADQFTYFSRRLSRPRSSRRSLPRRWASARRFSLM